MLQEDGGRVIKCFYLKDKEKRLHLFLRKMESQVVGWGYFDKSDTGARFVSLKCIGWFLEGSVWGFIKATKKLLQ